jgi:hypothetical protein
MIKCEKCGQDLLDFTIASVPSYCPNCGTVVSRENRENLFDATGDGEIEGIIKESILEAIGEYKGDLTELGYKAFGEENANGAFFCSNYKGRLFVARHCSWFLEMLYKQINEGLLSFDGLKSYQLEADVLIVGCFIDTATSFLNSLDLPDEITDENREEVVEIIKTAKDFVEA